MDGANALGAALEFWRRRTSIGKRPRTLKYHSELIAMIERNWQKCWNKSVSEISEDEVVEFAMRFSKFSVSRFNGVVSILRVTVPAAKDLKRRPIRLKDRALLSREQFARLIDALDGRPRSHGGPVVRFLAHTGLRINEARQLRWSDVYEDYIIVPSTITKNGHPRMIPMVPGLVDVLQQLRKIAGRRKRVIPQAEVQTSLRTACRLAGVPKLSHHDFRHLYATRCIQSGVDLPTVARWMGHRDGGALLSRTYFHLADEHSRRMAERVRI